MRRRPPTLLTLLSLLVFDGVIALWPYSNSQRVETTVSVPGAPFGDELTPLEDDAPKV